MEGGCPLGPPSSEVRWPALRDCLDLLEAEGCAQGIIDHSIVVAQLALAIASACGADVDMVFAGALLHDIGRSRDGCLGHVIASADIIRERGLPEELALIAERHLGAGVGAEEAEGLGLPARDLRPVSLEEKIVSHSDNLVYYDEILGLDAFCERMTEKGLAGQCEKARAIHAELSELCGFDIEQIFAVIDQGPQTTERRVVE